MLDTISIRIISTSFSEKAELELLTGVSRQDYEVFMDELWEPLVAADLRLKFHLKNFATPSPID